MSHLVGSRQLHNRAGTNQEQARLWLIWSKGDQLCHVLSPKNRDTRNELGFRPSLVVPIKQSVIGIDLFGCVCFCVLHDQGELP